MFDTLDGGTAPDPNPALRMTVIGTGYLGATHAVCMAAIGHEVVALDVDEAKIAALASGVLPFHEPGLPELLQEQLASGRLRFTTSAQEAAEFGDVHFICVGTPQQPGSYAADLTYVDASVRALAAHLQRPCLVVGKFTVPVGTAARLTAMLHELAPAGEDVHLTWNPEFLREGFAVEDTLRPDRLVFGVQGDGGAQDELTLRAVYAPVIAAGTPVVVTNLSTSELVKVAANSFLATKISFINAMAEVCEVTGSDVKDLAAALSHDTRIGGRFLRPGLGFGGGCLPKDIRAFMARANELGITQAVEFLREVDAINLRRRSRIVSLALEVSDGDLSGARVAVLGAAFKPDSDDIRDSPALDVADALRSTGAHVVVWDPHAVPNAKRAYPQLTYATSTEDALRGADLVLLLTEWEEFCTLDPVRAGELVNRRVMVDGRQALPAEHWAHAGWVYRALGRPAIPHATPSGAPVSQLEGAA